MEHGDPHYGDLYGSSDHICFVITPRRTLYDYAHNTIICPRSDLKPRPPDEPSGPLTTRKTNGLPKLN